MGQTPHGAPWPDPASPTRDGAAAIRALAEWTDLRAPWQVYAASGGYTTNQFGGVAITVPFASAVLGVGQLRTSGPTGLQVFLQSSNGAPANTYWFNAYNMADGSPVVNNFIVIDLIVMGY